MRRSAGVGRGGGADLRALSVFGWFGASHGRGGRGCGGNWGRIRSSCILAKL